jgi:hypothetical protein
MSRNSPLYFSSYSYFLVYDKMCVKVFFWQYNCDHPFELTTKFVSIIKVISY